ncbi:unnamed protein product [Vicia faba]|uniref:SAWADEE domain-containing protein n=1 Tax=Vicia faba TaxID=3906 RepID=A0AAV0ZJ44_VICFA|nr:unnamed protein product [Vicia faba]
MNRELGSRKKMSYSTEFRNHDDDAWYTVMVTVEENGTLRVTYEKFTDEEDQFFVPSVFHSLEDLQEFQKRFRPLSVQVQDHECRKLVPGVKVCASQHFIPDDLRFYDATVEAVQERPHSRKNEECHCTFILFWLHGPNAGNLTAAEIGDICILQPIIEVDPAVASFVEIVKKGIESKSGQEMVANYNEGTETKNRPTLFERIQNGRRRAKRSSVLGDGSPKVGLDENMEDIELEGKRNVCMILMGNLDKELCPSTAVDFLRKHTQVSTSVFIFSSLSSEIYTRGAIMVQTKQDFQKICDFLTNPNHIITSSTGRPWVVIEKQVGLKNIKASIGTFPGSEDVAQDGKNRTSINLKIVYSGTQEFKRASAMRELFLEFSDHQVQLHKKLALLEGECV